MTERKTWKSWLQDLIILAFIYSVFFAVVINSGLLASGYFTVYLAVGALLLGIGYLLFLGLSIKVDKIYSMILASVLIVVIAVSAYAALIITSPRWTFRLATDKPIYNLGEDVVITATMENQGYFSQSFTAAVADPVMVWVGFQAYTQVAPYTVWYPPFQKNESTFTVPQGQALTRTCVWNQTNTINPTLWNTTYKAGRYFIEAFIPLNPEYLSERHHWLVEASLYINVTGA